MRLSIIIAAHNDGETICQTIQACDEECRQLEHELIVVDDAATGSSSDLLRGKFPELNLISVAERNGASPSMHMAAQAATGDVLIFLNGHCAPRNGALQRLVEAVEELYGEAIVMPTIARLDIGNWQTSSEQVGHGYVVELERFECGWIPLEKMKQVPLRRRTYYESPALIGCAFAISRELYGKLWGFDSGMRISRTEALDLGFKCWLMGHQILHLPEAVVGHRFRSTFDNNQISAEHVAVSQLRMARKNFTDDIWNTWIARTQERFQEKTTGHWDGFWDRVWERFQAGRASLEDERCYLLGRRIYDEFWYAEHFELDWPSRSEGTFLSEGNSSSKSWPIGHNDFPLVSQQCRGQHDQTLADRFFGPHLGLLPLATSNHFDFRCNGRRSQSRSLSTPDELNFITDGEPNNGSHLLKLMMSPLTVLPQAVPDKTTLSQASRPHLPACNGDSAPSLLNGDAIPFPTTPPSHVSVFQRSPLLENRAPHLFDPITPETFQGDHQERCPCLTCADRRLRSPPTPAHEHLPQLAILTCHFNVGEYRRPLHNYWRWRYGLGCLVKNLVTVELSFNGQFQIPDAIQLQGTEKNILWQKEALLSVALKQLPPQIRVVIWCDCDILFENPHWAWETVERIEQGGAVFVQPFENIYYENGRGAIDFAVKGSVYEHQTLAVSEPFRHLGPGMCGAAARELLDEIGIPRYNIGGAGDRLLTDTFLGIHESPQGCLRKCLPVDRPRISAWCRQARAALRGRACSSVPGDIRHLFHGTIQNRQYLERYRMLERHRYEPADVRVDEQGLLSWATNKPELHRDIRSYFIDRREDG